MRTYKVEITLPPFVDEVEAETEEQAIEIAEENFWLSLQNPPSIITPDIKINEVMLEWHRILKI